MLGRGGRRKGGGPGGGPGGALVVQVPANLLGLGSHPPGFTHLAPNLEDPMCAWLDHVQPAYNCAVTHYVVLRSSFECPT
jgi:hypothetical protein